MSSPERPASVQGRPAPRVLVSILAYEPTALASATVEAFARQTHPCDIIVVDNGSSAPSLDALRVRHPTLEIVALEENRGYTGGNNWALEEGRRRGYDHVLVVNDDIDVERTAVASLVETAETRSDAGVIGAVEVDGRTGIVRATGGLRFNPWRGYAQASSRFTHGSGGVYAVESVPGPLVFFTKRGLDAGLRFDDALFMYYDEVALGFATVARGLRAYIDPRVQVRHSNNPRSLNPRAGYFHQRNRVYIVRRHGRPYHWVTFLALVTLVELPLKAAYRAVTGHPAYAWMCLLGHVDGLRGRMGRGRLTTRISR